MKKDTFPIRRAGARIALLAVLALSACGGPSGALIAPPTISTMHVPPSGPGTLAAGSAPPTASASREVSALSTSTSTSTPARPMITVEPGFMTTPIPLPSGFPILPQAEFVAYNPAFDPCLDGQRDCAPKQVSEQVWLYQLVFPPNSTMPVLTARTAGQEYAALLQAAGYQVQPGYGDEATILNFSGPHSGRIIIGPSVTGEQPLPGEMVIGLRISIPHRD